MRGTWDIPSDRVFVVAASSRVGRARGGRTQSQAASQSAADRQQLGAASGGNAATLSRLGSPQAARAVAAPGTELPHNTIHRILRRYDLVREEQRGAAAWQRFKRSRPNELWQMDFKGPKGWPQPVGPLSVLDDHSRYLIALAATGTTQGEPVRQQLEEAFQRCGVPEEMLMDHGSPWWGHLAPLGYTHLALWLMRQGIRLH